MNDLLRPEASIVRRVSSRPSSLPGRSAPATVGQLRQDETQQRFGALRTLPHDIRIAALA